MKSILIVAFTLVCHLIIGQNCTGPDHSINVSDSWLSCTENQNPNPYRGNTHWIMYDLGYDYKLGGTHFWNYNVDGNTNSGMRTISIDYSIDGVNWIELEEFELQEASEMSTYAGEAGPSFGGVTCRYILITAVDSWGNACVGLSEVMFDIDYTSAVLSDVQVDHSGITFYPNPTEGLFIVSGLVNLYDINVQDNNGNTIQNLNNKSSPISIDLSLLPSGIYFINIVRTNNPSLCMKKIIKQ